jgi:chromosome segregation ATPase
MLRVAAAASVIGGVTASANGANSNSSPVTKVIELINELKVKVQRDLEAETKAMSEYSAFCDDEQTQKGFAIKTAERNMDGYSAVIDESTGSITSLTGQIDAAGSEIASKSEELKSASNIRSNENTDFQAAEKELVGAIDTLARAVTIIKREMSFVQGGSKSEADKNAVTQKLQSMSGALDQIISAAWIDSSSRSKLKMFMSTDMDDELSLKAQQPQASVKNYESKSGGIVDTLEDMKDKAESTLGSLRREEMQAKHAFEMIKQSLSDAIAGLNKEVDSSSTASSGAQARLGQAQGDLASTDAAKKADEEYVSKLSTECKAKAEEWDQRQKSARDEMAALNKGSEILSAKFGFVQIAVKSAKSSDDLMIRDKVQSLLKKMGRQYSSFGLMQIAGAAAKDPFAKVRGLVEAMISKLEMQAQEEATHDSFCKEEEAKSAKAKETKQNNVDKLQARIDEASAAIAELQNEVSTLNAELAEIAAATKKATEIRSTEHADYLRSSKDFKEAAEAVTQAMVVLKDFYNKGAFVQTGVKQPEFGAARGDAGHAILEILETAQEDFTRLLAEAETSETEAEETFKALQQSNRVAKSTKESEVKNKTSEMKSLEVALTHHSSDYQTTSAELDAVLDYIQKLKPQCESKAMSYEERMARRDAVVAGLREALSLLEGDNVAAFIQKGFLARK